MIGRIFRTFAESFERPQVDRYCITCGRQFSWKSATDMFCSRRCLKKYVNRPAQEGPEHAIGPIYHGGRKPRARTAGVADRAAVHGKP